MYINVVITNKRMEIFNYTQLLLFSSSGKKSVNTEWCHSDHAPMLKIIRWIPETVVNRMCLHTKAAMHIIHSYHSDIYVGGSFMLVTTFAYGICKGCIFLSCIDLINNCIIFFCIEPEKPFCLPHTQCLKMHNWCLGSVSLSQQMGPFLTYLMLLQLSHTQLTLCEMYLCPNALKFPCISSLDRYITVIVQTLNFSILSFKQSCSEKETYINRDQRLGYRSWLSLVSPTS